MRRLALAVLATGFAACLPRQETVEFAEDLTIDEHARAAALHESEARQHEAQYNPRAAQDRVRCMIRQREELEVCWATNKNPTAKHLRAAKKHREVAAEHRAASTQLREAETQACARVTTDDRDISPFYFVGDIRSVRPLVDDGKIEGAVVHFNAVAGMTREKLQSIVDCHLARNASLGNNVPELAYCPLVPKGARARVVTENTGLAVVIEADERKSAHEIYVRARNLLTERL